MKKYILLSFTLFSILMPARGQQSAAPNWDRWNWLIGEWVGEGDGQPGKGSGSFSLLPDLDKKVLVRKNHSEYPATKDKPATVHDDLMIVYGGEPGKAIYFDNESHVINYGISSSDSSIVLTSGKMDKMPVFRLTYLLIDSNTITVKFEMSMNGGETFMTYTEGRCKRKK